MIEQFKLVSQYDNYMVSNIGNIWNSKTNCLINKFMSKHGYIFVYLYDSNNKRTIKFIHELVATEFLTPLDGCLVVSHKDNNKMNNNILNLEYVSKLISNPNTKLIESLIIQF
jgi:hypothetical protein